LYKFLKNNPSAVSIIIKALSNFEKAAKKNQKNESVVIQKKLNHVL